MKSSQRIVALATGFYICAACYLLYLIRFLIGAALISSIIGVFVMLALVLFLGTGGLSVASWFKEKRSWKMTYFLCALLSVLVLDTVFYFLNLSSGQGQ